MALWYKNAPETKVPRVHYKANPLQSEEEQKKRMHSRHLIHQKYTSFCKYKGLINPPYVPKAKIARVT